MLCRPCRLRGAVATCDPARDCKLLSAAQAICIIGGVDGTAPSELRVFTNRDDLDFAAVAELTPVQRWDLQENGNGQLEYPTQCGPCWRWSSSIDSLPSLFHIPRGRIRMCMECSTLQASTISVIGSQPSQPAALCAVGAF